MHYMFCVSGFSGVGKDEFCHRLVEKHGAVHTGLADPAKRHMAEVYGFSRDQLFGPSAMRNAGDGRYPKTILTEMGARPVKSDELLLNPSDDDYTDPEKVWWCLDMPDDANACNEAANAAVVMGHLDHLPSQKIEGAMRFFFDSTNPKFFLSPREALQLHCNLMNDLYLCTWVRHGVEVHRKLALLRDKLITDNQVSRPTYSYDRMTGLCIDRDLERGLTRDVVTCFSDFRHWHEIRYVEEAEREFGDFKTVLIRVKRPGIETPPYDHRSETEQATIPDHEFNFVVNNARDVASLHEDVDNIVTAVKAGKT